MKRVITLLLLLAVAAAVPCLAGSIIIGEPSEDGNFFPFGGVYDDRPGTRYQQAYAASDFPGLDAIEITGIDFFRVYGSTMRSGNYEVYLSTITAGIDTLSDTDFDSNLGPDNALFWSGTLSSTAQPDILSFAGTPFFYDPAAGNLLLDIRVADGGINGDSYWLARQDAYGIFSRYHNFGDGTTGSGLVTQFDCSAPSVPEPASFVLLIGSGVLLAIKRLAR